MKFKYILTSIILIITSSKLSKGELTSLIEELKSYEDQSLPKTNPFQNLRGAIPLLAIAGAVEKACKIWKVATALFGYRKTVVFHDIPMERGFETFQHSAFIVYLPNVHNKNINKVKNTFRKILEITPKDVKVNEEFEYLFDFIQFEDMGGWGKQDVLFKVNSDKAHVNYASILAGREEIKGNVYYQFFFIFNKAAFKLAPYIQMKVTTKAFGVFYNSINSEIKEIPASITAEDINAVFYFYNFICLKIYANYFGIKYDLPKVKLQPK